MYLALLLLGGLFYYRQNLQRTIQEKYQRFNRLYRAVSTRYDGRWNRFRISCGMVAKMYWIQFLQWANSAVEVRDKRKLIVHYHYNGQDYAIVTSIRGGPRPISAIHDEHDNDVTETILPFFGPGQDWHHHTFSPSFWNKSQLTFILSSGEKRTFSHSEPINV